LQHASRRVTPPRCREGGSACLQKMARYVASVVALLAARYAAVARACSGSGLMLLDADGLCMLIFFFLG